MKKHKTLTEWFDDLPLERKLDIYNLGTIKDTEVFEGIFTSDPPPVDVGTEPFDPTDGTE